MKAQFKYAFLSGLYVRGAAFAVILIMDVIFITLGSLGMLPLAAHITAVSLGGAAVAVMLAANIGGDVMISRRMFSAPEAYLYALTPVPRARMLFASVIAMAAMDIFTMAFVITAEVILSFNLVGGEIWQTVRNFLNENPLYLSYGLSYILTLISGYFLMMMIILFSVTMKHSLLYKMKASGFLSLLTAFGCIYIASLSQLLLTPFSDIQRQGLMIIVSPGNTAGIIMLTLLILLEAAGLFFLTSKLMERKINL